MQLTVVVVFNPVHIENSAMLVNDSKEPTTHIELSIYV